MIDVREVSEAIAEIEASRNQSPSMCLRLASLYIIRDHLQDFSQTPAAGWETAPNNTALTTGWGNYRVAAPMAYSGEKSGLITLPTEVEQDTDFLRSVEGRPGAEVWRILDDLMDTLRVTSPRAYNSVLRKIKDS